MLPHKLRLSRKVEHYVTALKKATHLSRYALTRIAFMISVNQGERYQKTVEILNGVSCHEKGLWLGELEHEIELILAYLYPDLNEAFMEQAWFFHVKEGLLTLQDCHDLNDIVAALPILQKNNSLG